MLYFVAFEIVLYFIDGLHFLVQLFLHFIHDNFMTI